MRRVSAPDERVAIIGAGVSALVADLVAFGYRQIEAVDISQAALDRLRLSLGPDADAVNTTCADVLDVAFERPVRVWHDRATFHFLTERAEQAAYAARAADAVVEGGHLVLATFAETGPAQCSGLPVARHSPTSLAAVFHDAFVLIDTFERDHITPWGARQAFLHAVLQRCP